MEKRNGIKDINVNCNENIELIEINLNHCCVLTYTTHESEVEIVIKSKPYRNLAVMHESKIRLMGEAWIQACSCQAKISGIYV